MESLKLHIGWGVFFSGCGLFLMTLGCQPAPVKPAAAEAATATSPAETPASKATTVAEKTNAAAKTVENATPVAEATSNHDGQGDTTSNHVEANTVDETGETVADSVADSTPAVNKIEVTLGDPQLTAGIPGEGDLSVDEIEAWLENPEHHAVLEVKLPMGLSGAAANITGIEENPLTLAKIELGRQLYFDTRLSADKTISCASCHHPDEGYAKATTFGEGIGGQTGNRNSPVSYNRIVSGPQFWDGRADSLEAQAVGPIANPIEMGNSHETCVATVQGIEGYRKQFEAIFGSEGVTIDNIGKAIATFERAIVTSPAPYDYLEVVRAIERQWEGELDILEEEDPELFAKYQVALKEAAKMSESARRGRDLFFSEKANCTACHAGANFSDEKYHNIGVGMEAEEPDWGRFSETQLDIDRGAFKTPTCRNVALTAPYMHDGSQATLEEVVEWYAKGGHPNPYLSEKIKKLDLNEQDKQDLVAFMKEGLTSDFPPVEMARLPVD